MGPSRGGLGRGSGEAQCVSDLKNKKRMACPIGMISVGSEFL